MPRDIYEEYRQPLTEEEQMGMPEAEEMLAAMEREADDPNSKLKREPNGFRYDGGDFIPNPVIVEHMGIAMQRAEQQFKGWPAMPENNECSIRYPDMDPSGVYSIIDMKAAQRIAQIKATLESRSPEVQEYTRALLQAEKNNPEAAQISFMLHETAKKHRILTRASKLCLDPAGRDLLHQQSRMLEADMAAEQYNKYLQGIEFAAGIRTGPVPREVQDFYTQRLQMPLNMDLIKQAEQLDYTPRKVKVEFQNLDHKLQQELFADPKNWGKTRKDLGQNAITAQQAEKAISPYACATVGRVVGALFNEVENIDPDGLSLNRTDNIIIGGKTVRERMYEDYIASGKNPSNFDTFLKKNYQQMTNEYVAGALMAGERVEAFIPDKNGRIPDQPVQLTKTGYEPSPLSPVTLNAWERFWAKRGFYQEKTKAAADYQRTMEARERVKSTNLVAQINISNGRTNRTMNAFFSDWQKENGKLPDSVPHGYSVFRAALPSTAICYMAAKGYDIKDIFDPSKLQAEKQQIGTEVVNRMMAGDQKWMGEVLFHGQRSIADQMDRYCRQINVLDNNELYRSENTFLFNAMIAAFDASQETSHCPAEYAAAAERHAPGNGAQAMAQVDNRINTVGDFFDKGRMALHASNQLAGGLIDPDNVESKAIQKILLFESARTAFSTKIAANPNAPFSSHFTIDSMQLHSLLYNSQAEKPAVQNLSSQLQKVEGQKTFGLAMIRGQAQNRMHIELDEMNPFNSKLSIDAPTKQEMKNMSRNREIQEIARQNASKSMGGRAK